MQRRSLRPLISLALALGVLPLPVAASEPPASTQPEPEYDEELPDFDEVELTTGGGIVGDVVAYIPGEYLLITPLGQSVSIHVELADVASITPSGWVPECDVVTLADAGFVYGHISELTPGKTLAVIPLGRITPIEIPWSRVTGYVRDGKLTVVPAAAPKLAPEPDKPSADTHAMVHIEQIEGATPVRLLHVSDDNPDDMDYVCTAPCDAWMAPGTYRVGSTLHDIRYADDSEEHARPSKPFTLQRGSEYTLTVTPHTTRRNRRVGWAVGAGISLLALVPVVIPASVDMPQKVAIGLYASGGVLAVVGLAAGVGISFSPTKVRIDSVGIAALPARTRAGG